MLFPGFLEGEARRKLSDYVVVIVAWSRFALSVLGVVLVLVSYIRERGEDISIYGDCPSCFVPLLLRTAVYLLV